MWLLSVGMLGPALHWYQEHHEIQVGKDRKVERMMTLMLLVYGSLDTPWRISAVSREQNPRDIL